MKIYTGSGDRGMTSLFSGERVKKSNIRVEAYGDVDELGSVLGALVSALPKDTPKLIREVRQIQSDLLHIGAWLAASPESWPVAGVKEITPKFSQALEAAIDRMEAELPDLKAFILPGGHASAAWAHIARTVCRRAERHVVRLLDEQHAGETVEQLRQIIVYLNRLSDYLFVFARHCNRTAGIPDVLWKK